MWYSGKNIKIYKENVKIIKDLRKEKGNMPEKIQKNNEYKMIHFCSY